MIGILDSDIRYSNKLMEYLNRRIRMIAQIRVFSDSDNLLTYLKHNQLDVLLLEECLYPLKGEDLSYINVVVLTENSQTTKGAVYPSIHKYQSAQGFLEKLIEVCSELKEGAKGEAPEDTLEIITTYSLGCGGIGEIFSYLLSHEYASMGNCLFMNLVPFTGLLEGSTIDGNKGMTDLIYYLNEKVDNLGEKIELISKKIDNMHVITEVTFSTDLCDLSMEGMRNLIGTIRECRKYKFLIINIGYVSPAIFELFQACNKLYVVARQEETELRAKDNLLKQLKWADLKGITKKLELIIMSGEDIDLLSKRYEEGVEVEGVTTYMRKYLTH